MNLGRVQKALSGASLSRTIATGGLVAAYVILLSMQESEECGKGSDYLNPRFLAKLLSMVDLAQTGLAIYSHLDEAKANGVKFLKKATFASGAVAIGTFGGLWGATGHKAALACKIMNPVFNFMTERFANAYARSGPDDQQQAEVNLEDGREPLNPPPGYRAPNPPGRG